jgi:PAS domain S-box-containing protein
MVGAQNENGPQAAGFLSGGGEMGRRMRELDWSETPLGPVEQWPQSLRSAVSIMLASRAQIVLFWGPELAALYNDAYTPTFGSKHPWALGRPARECWAEIWEDTLRALFEGVLRSGKSFYADEYPFFLERHGYLEETFYDVSYDPVRDENGAISGIFCIVSDATGRVLERRRWQTLRELSVRALSEARRDKQACRVAAETIGENSRDVPFALIYLIDADREMARLAAAAGIEQGTPNSPMEVPLRSAMGEGVWPLREVASQNTPKLVDATPIAGLPCGAWDEPPHSVIILPLAAPGQELPTGLLVAAVSPRRLLDDVYQNFYLTIAGHISTAITHARAYEQERQRAEALAELDRAKTAFFSNVSHEFRTPLTLMLGPLEDALSRRLDPNERHELEVIHRNGLRLLRLVNTLLDFSRIEAGRVQAVYEPVDLAALTAELASVFRSAIERAGLRLVVDCPPLAEAVYVDREMWEKIVLNLLSNAFKFTFEGHIEVGLRAQDDHAELRVRDTGTGIAEEELPRLFERFHRIRGAQARTHEGTGIGLALVQELVKLHGGGVSVESEAGKGTTFIVTVPFGSSHLPADRVGADRHGAPAALGAQAYVDEALRWLPEAVASDQLPAASKERASHSSSAASQSTQAPSADHLATDPQLTTDNWRPATDPRPLILLADDNADMRDYVKRVLSAHWIVKAEADGRAALAAARERVPDLVISDVMMPGLDGFELLRELRSDPLTRRVPVILLSARAGEESRIEGLDAGADDYMAKPFSARELVAHVGAHLKIARIRSEAERELRANEARIAADLEAMTRLHEVGNLCARAGDEFDQCLSEIIATAIAVTGADKGNVQLLDTETGALTIAAHRGFEAPFLNFFHSVRDTAATCARAMQTARRVAVEDVTESEIFAGQPALKVLIEAGVRAVQSTPLWSSTGNLLGMISTHFNRPHHLGERELRLMDLLARQAADYLERRQAEERLRESEARLRYLFDKAPTFVALMSGPEHVFDLANAAYLQLVGQRELIGRNVRDALFELEGQGFFELLDDVYRTGEPFVGREMRVTLRRTPGGPLEERFLDFVYQAVFEADGNVSGIFTHGVDVTEQVRARKAIEEVNRLKDEFLATLSHELRNPLNSILGYAEVLRRSAEAKQSTLIQQAATTINNNAQAQAQLINDLLDLSRLQTGKLAVESQPLSLAPLIGDAVETVRAQAVKKGIKLDVDLIAEPLTVNADPVRLQQIVWNLINNALKFTPKGGRVTVTLDRERDDARLIVEDSGQGISAEFLPHVFEMFRQADAGVTRRHGGLGVGLALVRQLTELHGGKVEVHSEGQGRGARFTVRLPLLREPLARSGGAASSQLTGELSGARILIVDDTQDSLDMLHFLLSGEGASVKTAASGAAGLAIANEADFDLVISDISMPEMDGYEFLQALRTNPRHVKVPAIALTGFGREEDIARTRQAGFTTHLTKPLDFDNLLQLARLTIEK